MLILLPKLSSAICATLYQGLCVIGGGHPRLDTFHVKLDGTHCRFGGQAYISLRENSPELIGVITNLVKTRVNWGNVILNKVNIVLIILIILTWTEIILELADIVSRLSETHLKMWKMSTNLVECVVNLDHLSGFMRFLQFWRNLSQNWWNY